MINPLVLGTSKLARDGDLDAAFALLDAWIDVGGTAIDTASIYSDWIPGTKGRSELALGQWLRARGNRDRLQITTKGAHPPIGHMDQGRCDPTSIRADIELSLQRLGTDRIDLWYLHRDDRTVPAAEIVGALQELQREGKILAFGGSNWRPPRIGEALAVPGPTFTATQVLGNAFCRIKEPNGDPTIETLDSPAFRQAVKHNLRLDLYSSQALGFLDKRASGAQVPAEYDNPACRIAAEKIEAIAKREGVPPTHLILAFMIGLSPLIRPIIGPHNADQLRGSWPAGEIKLDSTTLREVATATGMAGFLA